MNKQSLSTNRVVRCESIMHVLQPQFATFGPLIHLAFVQITSNLAKGRVHSHVPNDVFTMPWQNLVWNFQKYVERLQFRGSIREDRPKSLLGSSKAHMMV